MTLRRRDIASFCGNNHAPAQSFLLAFRARGLGTLLGPLSSVFGAAATPAIHPKAVQRSTNDVIANARQILYTTPTNQHDRVLLQIVTFARNVGDDLVSVCQA